MGLFGSEPVDFEAQIAEINASAERRRAILTQIAREKEAGARASAQLKALRSKKLASQKKAVRKLGQVPSAPAAKRPISSRLKEMAEDFYEPDPTRRPQLDPWEEEAEFIKSFRAQIEDLKRRHRNRTACGKK